MAIYDQQGRILVKSGDMISKYNQAIDGTWGTEKDWAANFGRPVDNKTAPPKYKAITNYNLIDVGETILYLPVWTKTKRPGVVIPVKPDPGFTPEQRKELVTRLINEAGMRPSWAEAYVNLLGNWVDGADLAVNISELVTPILNYMGYMTSVTARVAPVAEAGGHITAFLGAFLFTAQGLMAWHKARKTGLLYVTLRASAYATTSWVWDDPPPRYPASLADNLGKGPVTDPTLTVADFRNAWDASVLRTHQALDNIVTQRGEKKIVVQCGLGFTERTKKELAVAMMYYLEQQVLSESNIPFFPPYVRDTVHMAFFSPYPDYPN